MSIWWIPAEVSHVAEIARKCRAADRDEIWAAEKITPEEALLNGLAMSPVTWTGVADGLPICMFGVSPWCILGAAGAPWMIGTTDIKPHARAFLKGSKKALEAMREPYDMLVNLVDARHVQAIRWLKWLGFTVHAPIPYGPFGMAFHPFEWRRI